MVYWKVSKEGSETVTGSAVISIVKAPLTIKADNQSMYVGGKLPTFTYTATGLVKGETLTHVDLTCEADGKTTGKFDIVPSSADAGNNYKDHLRQRHFDGFPPPQQPVFHHALSPNRRRTTATASPTFPRMRTSPMRSNGRLTRGSLTACLTRCLAPTSPARVRRS